jgi:hypothetical protein
MSGLLRGFSTCCLRFRGGVATALPARWLTFTGRGSNPLDPVERFADSYILFPLSWIYPAAMVINLKTAKLQGFTVPPTLLARADELIE